MRQILISIVVLVFTAPLMADETQWTKHMDVAESRVFAAKSMADNDGTGWFAWELRLQPGWKVYWRSPGEAGLPPKLKLNPGASVTSVEPYFPLPKRFELYGLQTFGYGTVFVLPFKAEGGAPNAPMLLNMEVDFMICKDVCIPFIGEYQLQQSGESHAHSDIYSATISMWNNKVPDTSGKAVAGLKIANVTVKGVVGHQSLVFEVEAEQNLSNSDMLIESDEVFTFGKPKLNLRGRGNKAMMIVSVDGGRQKADIKGREAILTFTDGRGNAIERKIEF